MNQTPFPSRDELFQLFWSDPVEVEDGVWCYEYGDEDGLRLRVLLYVARDALQTVLLLGEKVICSVYQERMAHFSLIGNGLVYTGLHGDFKSASGRGGVTIMLRPEISVSWDILGG